MMPIMTRRDARSLDHHTLEEMRRLAVSRVLQGETLRQVAESLQVHWCTVAKWMAAYRRGGADALQSRKAPGPQRKLTSRQLQRLRRMIVEKTPQQLRFPFALWTLRLVGQLIEREFEVVLHKTTVGRLLRDLGLTPQRPTRQSFQRDAEECRRWAAEEFPRIVRAVRRRQATLLFADETGVHEDGPVDRTWGAKGQRPVVRVTGRRDRVNVISAVSPRGRLWFRCYRGTLGGPRFVEFLRVLLRDVRGEIELIIDKHPAHVAAVTRRYLQSVQQRLRVHYLPGYAPDLNPDEHVWSHLKGLFRRQPLRPEEKLAEAVQETMAEMQTDRALVRAFFDHPAVSYVKQALHW